MSDLIANDGCLWEVGQSTKGIGPSARTYIVFCNKLRAPDSVYCPKHKLFKEDAENEPARKASKRKLERDQKKIEMEMLAVSPLRADNSEFGLKRGVKKIYTEPESK